VTAGVPFAHTLPGVPDEDKHTVQQDLLNTCALSNLNWCKAQCSDPVITVLIRHLSDGTRPDKTCKMTSYTRDWGKLLLRDNVLNRQSTISGCQRLQLVLPESLRRELYFALHDDLGHQGRDRTLSLVRERFNRPSMDSDVAAWIRSCDRCICRKTLPDRASLVPIVTTAPMELVSIDFLSLELSKGGFEHILLIFDNYTRYVQALPARNQTAKTTAKLLFENFVVHYGFPSNLHSVQGKNFLSTTIKELCALAGVERSPTTPYHPMGNGMTERCNQTLLKMMGTLQDYQKADWKSHNYTNTRACLQRHTASKYWLFSVLFDVRSTPSFGNRCLSWVADRFFFRYNTIRVREETPRPLAVCLQGRTGQCQQDNIDQQGKVLSTRLGCSSRTW